MSILNSIKTHSKKALFAVTTAAPMFAMAADDAATTAASKISALETGVGTVGAAILGVTLVIIGYKVITRMTNRA